MSKPKNCILFVEVYKYPYCCRPDDTEYYLSDKICRYTIKIRKKTVKKMKFIFVYGDLILRLTTGVAPAQAIGLPVLRVTSTSNKIYSIRYRFIKRNNN